MKKLINLKLMCILLLMQSCTPSNESLLKNKEAVFKGHAMTMDYKILLGHSIDQTEKENIQNLIHQTFDEINSIYNKWNPESEISKLNRLKKKTIVPISKKLQTFLKETEKLVILSNGLFDPTIEPIQKLWKEALKKGVAASNDEIEKKMKAVGFDKIHFENHLFHKDHDETSLDLGGIAKGYAVDLLISRLNDSGYVNAFVEWGGEIKATGKHPDNRPWHIFISRFQDTNPEAAIDFLDLENEAIATSGDYLQNWTLKNDLESTTYFHVINPKTGSLLKIGKHSIASTSVVAKSCLVADVLATTLMLFEKESDAKVWIEGVKDHHEEIKYWIVTRALQPEL